MTCEICGIAFEAKRRHAKTCSPNCRKELSRLEQRVKSQVVLSLFPGGDLLGRAFEAAGFCVVRGPDVLWGGDVRDFHVPSGKFDGVIGGPPCQIHSNAGKGRTKAIDLIPEYLRLVSEAAPKWAVMENVLGALEAESVPSWPHTVIRDWDCGGKTHRTRAFWFYGVAPAVEPLERIGQPERSVMASSWKNRKGTIFTGIHEHLTPEEAAQLQDYPELAQAIVEGQPAGVSNAGRACLAVHMLGNGVPRQMARYVAEHVKRQVQRRDNWNETAIPPYPLFLTVGK